MKTHVPLFSKKILILFIAVVMVFPCFSQTWGVQQVPVGDDMHDIDMITGTRTGYGVAINGRIIKTTDGGLTWAIQPAETNQTLKSVNFFHADTGYIAGDSGLVITTVDGGLHWESLSTGTFYQLNDIHVHNNFGFIVGDSGTALRLWNNTITPLNTGINSHLRAVYMFSPARAIAVGGTTGDPVLLVTIDSGETWIRKILPGITAALHDVSFVEDSIGFISGNSGTILKSSDHGVTWKLQESATNQNLYAITVISSKQAYATGAGGTIISMTSDSSWTNLVSGVSGALNGISFNDEYTIYTSGAGGTILKTCPYAAFSVTAGDSVCVGKPSGFINGSFNASAYAWCIGDDTIGVTEHLPGIFDKAGTYAVRLFAGNGTCNSFTQERTIMVMPRPEVELGNDTLICMTCEISLHAGDSARSYRWYRNGELLDDTGSMIIASAQGSYRVRVTSYAGCDQWDSISITKVATGLAEKDPISSLSVYPNPSNGNFNLHFVLSANKEAEINISDLMGNTVYSERVHCTVFDKNMIFDAAPGIYLLRISTSGEIRTTRILIAQSR